MKFFELALIFCFCISCKNHSQQTQAFQLSKEPVPLTQSVCWLETRELAGVQVIDIFDGLTVIPSYTGGNENYTKDVYDRLRIRTNKTTVREVVFVVMVIDTIGTVRKACIYNKNEETYTNFEREILEAVKQLQWTPGEKNDKKVPVSTIVKFKSEDIR